MARGVRGRATASGLLGLLVLVLAGCGGWVGIEAEGARLRVHNAGSTPIAKLTVVFPDDRISFGDVAAGATTAYRDVPNGVYAYAAYSLEIGGAIVTQPVIDWVGEEPMEGGAFTYTLEVVPGRTQFPFVQLVSVTQDE